MATSSNSSNTNTTSTMSHAFKIPLFTPMQPDIWVTMVEDAFAIHKITDNRYKMHEIRMALTQEVRALTTHLTTGHTNADYAKLTTYLRNYGSRSDVQKLRAMVAKRPLGDKTPTEHLHALRAEFGTKPETLVLLRRIFEDSLTPHIAALLAIERIDDIDSYADRASELYILYEPSTTTVANIAATELTFSNNELMQTLKTLSSQMASLTAEVNLIKSPSHAQPSLPPAREVQPPDHHATSPYPTFHSSSSYTPRAQPSYQPRSTFNQQSGPRPTWQSTNNREPYRPPQRQQTTWRSQPQQPERRPQQQFDFSAPLNSEGLCPYHQQFGNQARNCRPGCIYQRMHSTISTMEESEN